MPVAFQELEGSPSFRGGTNGLVGVRRFKVAWADRIAFYSELRGTYRTIGGSSVILQPARFPDAQHLVCSDVSVDPFLPDSPLGTTTLTNVSINANTYEHALLVATYTPQISEPSNAGEPEAPEGTVISLSGDISAEYLTVPGRFWKWEVDDAKLPDDLNPGILLPCRDIVVRWSRVPNPPWTAIYNCMGKVNASTKFVRYPAETLLFLGEQDSRQWQIDDDGLWTLEYHFKFKANRGTSGGAPKGWNHFYRQTAAAGEHWLKIVDADGNPPYLTADFSTLFEFEA